MSKVQRKWSVDSKGMMNCTSGLTIIFSFDLIKVYPEYKELNLTQQSGIYYGIKQILSDYHDKDGDSTIATLNAMSDMLIADRVNKTIATKKTTKVEAAAIIRAYESADDKEVKAMFKKILEEQGIMI